MKHKTSTQIFIAQSGLLAAVPDQTLKRNKTNSGIAANGLVFVFGLC